MRRSDHQWSWIVGTTLVTVLIIISLGLLNTKTLERLDLLMYDIILPFQSPKMSDQVVIVAIDDASINQLGRWPWSRQHHADLIGKLTDMQPRAIGIDLIFSEAETNSKADQALAKALTDNSRTVLAVAPAQQTPSSPIIELLPIPILADASSFIGHVDAELDIDGLTRHFYLYAGLENIHWRSFALAMLEVGDNQHPIFKRDEFDITNSTRTGTGWVRDHLALIPFTKSEQQALRFSYADILSNRISPDLLHNKYILIGVTSTGVGDMISTPVNHSHQRMSGVELIAHQLNGLIQDKLIYPLPMLYQSILTTIVILISVTTMCLVPLRHGLTVTLVSTLVIIIGSISLLLFQRIWFAPSVALLMIMVSWPIWSLWQHYVSERLTKHLIVQLDEQSRHHLVTGLPNHGMLQDHLYKLTQSDANADSEMTALFIVHINWPESATSIIGRAMDDSIMQNISTRLKTVQNKHVFIAHLRDDDFAILITKQQDIGSIHSSAADVLAKLKTPLNHYGEELIITPNIGVSVWPIDSRDSTDLLRKAYTAMFKSRMDIEQAVCVYSEDIGYEIAARAELEKALSCALERNEFKVLYQPQVDAISGKLIGAEALLRWHNSELGWVGPDTFIPVAEQSGLINSIGDWVLKMACNDLKNIMQAGLTPIQIAVNLSPLQFSNVNLAEEIAATLKQADIKPDMLKLEVTESMLMNNINDAVQAMEKLKQCGMRLAIDDFGTGYSSLKHLQNFPLDQLKIDKCFTQDLDNKNTKEITLSIIDLAKRLNLNVIAEGVETEVQDEFMRKHGCDEMQGYLYSKAVNASDLIELMKTGITKGR